MIFCRHCRCLKPPPTPEYVWPAELIATSICPGCVESEREQDRKELLKQIHFLLSLTSIPDYVRQYLTKFEMLLLTGDGLSRKQLSLLRRTYRRGLRSE